LLNSFITMMELYSCFNSRYFIYKGIGFIRDLRSIRNTRRFDQ